MYTTSVVVFNNDYNMRMHAYIYHTYINTLMLPSHTYVHIASVQSRYISPSNMSQS